MNSNDAYVKLVNKYYKAIKDLSLLQEQVEQLEIKIKEVTKREQIFKNFISELNEEIAMLKKEVQQLKMENIRKDALLNQDSNNSSIPTSQTPINKRKRIPNSREKTNKKIGGQEGHKKSKLNRFEDSEVNNVIEEIPQECPFCGCKNLSKTGNVVSKDELDFKIVIQKTRHNFVECQCEECQKVFKKNIPNNLKEENQYGSNVQAFILALLNIGNVSMNKVKKIVTGITNNEIKPSEGYIAKLQKRAFKKLFNFDEDLYKKVITQELLCWDDTVIMVNKARACFRFYGNEKVALYKAHLHKNLKGLDEDNVLNLLSANTTVMHDHLKLNYNAKYSYNNAECNAHILRKLKAVTEFTKHKWSAKLTSLIMDFKNKRDSLVKEGKLNFSKEELSEFSKEYDSILAKGLKEFLADKNKIYGDKEQQLINCLRDFKEAFCLWVLNFNIPFTNNISERALRNVKSKMKISGQFKNIDSAKYFARIKSYIETCYRNEKNSYISLVKLVEGEPYTVEDLNL